MLFESIAIGYWRTASYWDTAESLTTNKPTAASWTVSHWVSLFMSELEVNCPLLTPLVCFHTGLLLFWFMLCMCSAFALKVEVFTIAATRQWQMLYSAHTSLRPGISSVFLLKMQECRTTTNIYFQYCLIWLFSW